MGKYFGTDGFRGEANVDLTVMHAFEIGRYLGWYYGKDKKARVVIGKDTRRSSYMLESALCAGLGCRCVSSACHNNAQRFICCQSRRFRLRHYDLGKPQSLLR